MSYPKMHHTLFSLHFYPFQELDYAIVFVAKVLTDLLDNASLILKAT